MARENRFKWKVFTSLLLAFSFFLTAVSGLVLYLTPRGRIAQWVEWTILSLDKEEWTDLHLIGMVLMLVTALLHLFVYNWKVFLTYFKRRSGQRRLRYPRELVVSTLVFLLLFFGAFYKVPVLYSVTDLREWIKDTYEVAQNQAPVAHTEDMALKDYSQQILGLSFSEMKSLLEAEGWQAEKGSETLLEFAKRNGTTPRRVHEQMAPHAQPSDENQGTAPGTPPLQEGGGYGQMSVEVFCQTRGIILEDALRVLHEEGATEAEAGDKLKELAEDLGGTPIDVARTILNRVNRPDGGGMERPQ